MDSDDNNAYALNIQRGAFQIAPVVNHKLQGMMSRNTINAAGNTIPLKRHTTEDENMTQRKLLSLNLHQESIKTKQKLDEQL